MGLRVFLAKVLLVLLFIISSFELSESSNKLWRPNEAQEVYW